MNSLREDLDELPKELHSWCRRKRRQAGIAPEEASCWFVYHEEQGGEEPPESKSLGRSPGDMLAEAEAIAGGLGLPQRGTGRWVWEIYGDGENAPEYLVVRPVPDEQQP